MSKQYVESIVAESAVEDDDQGFFDPEREVVIEALTQYDIEDITDEDREWVADYMEWVGFDREDWTKDAQ